MRITYKDIFPIQRLPSPPPSSPFYAFFFFSFSPFTWSLISGCSNLLFTERLNGARKLQKNVVSHRPPLQAAFGNFSRCAELLLLSVCEISSHFLRRRHAAFWSAHSAPQRTNCLATGVWFKSCSTRKEQKEGDAGKEDEEVNRRMVGEP